MRRSAAIWLCLAAFVTVGCGGAGDGRRAELELVLAAGGVSYCGGSAQCRDFDAVSATCSDPRRIVGRTFYECTIDYESTEPSAEVCASYDPTDPTDPVMREREKC